MLSALSKMAARNCIFVKCFLKKTRKNTPLQLNFECSGAFWLNLVTLLGDWVILKKGFTPKLRPSNACECVDAQWCKAVTTDTLEAIKAAFRENPKARQKFDLSPDMPTPAIAGTWLRLTEAQATALKELLTSLPERFTKEQFWAQAAAFQKSIADPSAGTHILYIYGYP